MRWQAQRGLLNPLDGSPPGSRWWRAVNERLLRDGCEAVALVGGRPGEPSSQAVRLWLGFIDTSTPSQWYRAHNASIVAGYLEHEALAEAENAAERFFINVALARVLYAHALVAAPGLALGRLAWLARQIGDPRFGMTGVFLALRRVIPDYYPLDRSVEWYVADEQRLRPIARLRRRSAATAAALRVVRPSLSEPRLLGLVREGNPIYAWPYEQRHVWRSTHLPSIQRVVERATRAQR